MLKPERLSYMSRNAFKLLPMLKQERHAELSVLAALSMSVQEKQKI